MVYARPVERPKPEPPRAFRRRMRQVQEEGAAMAKALGGKATVSIEELVLAQSYEMAALLNVLERKGMLTQGEALEEVKRLREKAAKAR